MANREKVTPREIIVQKIKEVVARWDKGDVIQSIEMGGLGPGYEQCIQIAIVELVRDNVDKPLPDFTVIEREQGKEAAQRAWWDWGNETIHRIEADVGGFSGAQVGAAKNVAINILRKGWDATLQSVEKERLTLVSKHLPKSPEPVPAGATI